MATEGMTGKFRKGTSQFMRQGHTTNAANGQDINASVFGQQADPPKDLKGGS